MADKTPDQEPSIEEILASIRQIISDDDDKDAGAAPAAPAKKESAKSSAKAKPKPEPEPEPVPQEPEEDEGDADVLELTEADAISVPDEPEPEELDETEEEYIEVDLQDVEEETAPVEEEIPVMPTPPVSQNEAEDSILSPETRKAAVFSMAKLAGNMPINRPSHAAASVTLEDIVREILNPMLRDWMDQNLPPMVERIVQKELEKLARQVMDE